MHGRALRALSEAYAMAETGLPFSFPQLHIISPPGAGWGLRKVCRQTDCQDLDSGENFGLQRVWCTLLNACQNLQCRTLLETSKNQAWALMVSAEWKTLIK